MHRTVSTNPLSVSVVIPTYNRLHVLDKAIASARDQTLSPIEIIVVDDGSTDGTTEHLTRQSASIKVISQGNHGVSHARNRGIESAQGQWIALLDSDDYWHKNKLQKQLQTLESEPDIRLIHCDEIWIRNGKRVNPKHKHRKHGGHIFEHCLPLCAISPSASLIHHSVFLDHGLFDESLPACEDYDMWLRVTSQEPVSYIDEMLLTKTGGHEDQLSHRYTVMDQFRIQSLAKLIRSNVLTRDKHELASQMMALKLGIVVAGARKHDNQTLLQKMNADYPEWMSELSRQ